MLPPLFLHSYGVAQYGEWLTLTAAVSYLGTLNFGLQTFTNNRTSISYNRGEYEEVKELQATAFALLLGIVTFGALISLLVLFLPVSSWLKLKLTSRAASLIIYLLGLQVLSRMVFGFLAGSFLALGVSYRGNYWNNAQALTSLVGTAALVLLRSSLTSIAALQVVVMFLFAAASGLDLRIKAPEVFPKPSYFRRARIKEILKPSGYFGMLYCSNFLVFQVPVVVMQRILGPQNVVVFSLSRTIFSMSRHLLSSMSLAIAPEIVELYGQRNWKRLLRLYDLSERMVFALVPVVSVGTFLASPILIALWLHKPDLYNVNVCIYMALISAAMGTKEHKYQFQTSANEHIEMARFLFRSYIAMVAFSVPAIEFYGACGFLALWLLTEMIQLAFILHLNRRFFEHVVHLDFTPLYRLAILMTAAMALCGAFALANSNRSLVETGGATVLAVVALLAIAYPVFKVHEMGASIRARLLRRV